MQVPRLQSLQSISWSLWHFVPQQENSTSPLHSIQNVTLPSEQLTLERGSNFARMYVPNFSIPLNSSLFLPRITNSPLNGVKLNTSFIKGRKRKRCSSFGADTIQVGGGGHSQHTRTRVTRDGHVDVILLAAVAAAATAGGGVGRRRDGHSAVPAAGDPGRHPDAAAAEGGGPHVLPVARVGAAVGVGVGPRRPVPRVLLRRRRCRRARPVRRARGELRHRGPPAAPPARRLLAPRAGGEARPLAPARLRLLPRRRARRLPRRRPRHLRPRRALQPLPPLLRAPAPAAAAAGPGVVVRRVPAPHQAGAQQRQAPVRRRRRAARARDRRRARPRRPAPGGREHRRRRRGREDGGGGGAGGVGDPGAQAPLADALDAGRRQRLPRRRRAPAAERGEQLRRRLPRN